MVGKSLGSCTALLYVMYTEIAADFKISTCQKAHICVRLIESLPSANTFFTHSKTEHS